MKAYNPKKNAATGSAGEAATFLAVSVIALIAAISLQFWGLAQASSAIWTVGSVFLVWLSATTFTLGILEYRRSQMPAQVDHGPEV